MRNIGLTCGTVALAALLASPAGAQDTQAESTKLTQITFSGPIEVPGVTLPAGTYTFLTPDPGDHIVQIFDKDRSKIYATIITLPNDRLTAADQTVVMFGERPTGIPQAIKVWFYPGNPVGEEFIYPEAEALRLADAYHTTVLASDSEKVTKNGKTVRIDETGETSPSGAGAVPTSGTTTPAPTDRQ
jgi:hypothetical protein